MVEKVKNLNWSLYSDIGLTLANISAIVAIATLMINTKAMSLNELIGIYLVIGLMTLILLKLNHAVISK